MGITTRKAKDPPVGGGSSTAYILYKQHRIGSTEDWTLNRNSVATEPALALATQGLCSPGSQPLDSQPAFQQTELAVEGARSHFMCQRQDCRDHHQAALHGSDLTLEPRCDLTASKEPSHPAVGQLRASLQLFGA